MLILSLARTPGKDLEIFITFNQIYKEYNNNKERGVYKYSRKEESYTILRDYRVMSRS